MTNTDRLTELFNLSRSGSWTSDHTIELAAAIKAASDDELRISLMRFTQGLLRTAHTLKTCALHAAIGQAAIEEREQNGGHLQ